MDKQRETEVRLKAEDDKAKSVDPVVSFITLGIEGSNYNPPSDPEEKAVYDHYFKK